MSFSERVSRDYNLILLIVFSLFLLFFLYNLIIEQSQLILHGSMTLLFGLVVVRYFKKWKSE
ncbi:hypothetical protein Asal01_01201 [Fodinibius salicampi]